MERWCFSLPFFNRENSRSKRFTIENIQRTLKGGLISNTCATLCAKHNVPSKHANRSKKQIAHSTQNCISFHLQFPASTGRVLVFAGMQTARQAKTAAPRRKTFSSKQGCRCFLVQNAVLTRSSVFCTHTTPSSILKRGEAYQLKRRGIPKIENFMMQYLC